jgi:hypothetical protein
VTIDVAGLVVGIVGIIVGLAGIYFTVLTSPAALNAVGEAVSGSGLPSQFKGLSGGLTLFSAVLIMLVSFVLLFIGLVGVFVPLLKLFNVPEPMLGALWLVTWLYVISAIVTIGLFTVEIAFFVGIILVCAASLLMAVSYRVAHPSVSPVDNKPNETSLAFRFERPDFSGAIRNDIVTAPQFTLLRGNMG